MPFNVALSGLRSSSTELEVTGNNIANASTVGFKKSRTEFGDLYSSSFSSGSGSGVGDGVLVQNIRQQFSQGNVSFTDNGLDLAINGNGFFVLSDNGEAKYSRAGQFGVNRDGFMVSNSGMRVQGFQADSDGTISGVVGDLVVDATNLPPVRTTDVEMDLNLDSSQEVLEERGSSLPSDGATIGIPTAGTANGYGAQDIDINLANGTTTTINVAANASAGSIAAAFGAVEGVQATATTTVTIPAASFTNTGTMNVGLNGLIFSPTGTGAAGLADLGSRINSSALVGITAVVDSATGDLQIIQSQGADMLFGFAGGVGESFDVVGSDAAATALTLDTATTQATIGGAVNFILDEGVTLSNASATTPILATFLGAPFVNNQFDPNDPATYNHATSTSIFDSLGNSHIFTSYFVKQDTTATTGQPNTWQMHILIDGNDVGDPLIGTTASRATYNLVFENDGTLNTTLSDQVLVSNWTPLDSNGNANGADGPQNVAAGGALPIPNPPTSSNFEIDIGAITQFGSPFGVNDLAQNGSTTGRLVGVDVDPSGIILSRFTNGESLILGQLAMAAFNDVEGLSPNGDSTWVQTFESGAPIVGAPGTASLGTLTSSAIEESNVDLSEQLVNLIVAQRNFQANSKTIETADTIQQTILNI